MGFLRRLFGYKQTSSLAPGRGWVVPVVGESHYQDVLEMLYRKNGGSGHDIKVSAALVPEDDNAFDPNAVRIEIDLAALAIYSGRWLWNIERRWAKALANAAPK